MLTEQPREQWRARERAAPIYPVMTFTPDGLVLGAGTVLLISTWRIAVWVRESTLGLQHSGYSQPNWP